MKNLITFKSDIFSHQIRQLASLSHLSLFQKYIYCTSVNKSLLVVTPCDAMAAYSFVM